ncbi:hypothetical protein KIM372_04900 [Bombiscardovia nodaiensis]|uniref:Signal peptidase I n=1 Tax=Bombiscardovia nodaiensis TaxID=2932181 RepID=A0ABM8B799_9BIFI|nr:hypothetical protein KIM372_04900 [Bombiscardovia nodaiensis]
MQMSQIQQEPARRLKDERKRQRIRAKQNRPRWQQWLQEAVWLLICVLVVVLLRAFVFGAYEIPSPSMEHTLDVGDRIVASKLQPKMSGVHRGDIVIFHDPDHWLNTGPNDDYLIKRVIGVAGDKVSADGSGPVTVNGKTLEETEYIMPGSPASKEPFTVTVKEGFIFVMGDNRSNSADSRFHLNDINGGQVPLKNVEAIANFTYWPLDRTGFLRRPDSVFAGLQ